VLVAQQPPNKPAGTPRAGEALFFGKAGCADCHEVNGRGGVTGPNLSAAGQRSPETLLAKIRNPNSAPAPAAGRGGGLSASTIIVKTRDGREIRGVIRSEDTFTLQMTDASGQLHLLDKLKLAEVRYDTRSLMPTDYASRLTAQELEDLSPMSFAVDGRQYIAVASGGSIHCFALPSKP
jgi:cytochrome c oxidase cbb3-type subunit III